MNRRRTALLALLLIAPIQLIGTTAAMVWFPDSTVAKVGFGLAKVLLMLAPLAWLIFYEKQRPRLPRWRGLSPPLGPPLGPESHGRGRGFRDSGMLAAHVTGAIIFVVIAAAYFLVGRHWIDTSLMQAKVRQMGLDNLWLYLAAALYWCTINSLLEEYFWRWFIFERLRDVLPRPAGGETHRLFSATNLAAVVLCGLLFTAHHVVALRVYFDWNVTILASLGVFMGGFTWSLIYLRYRNIYAAYVSHVYADLIIFYIGYCLIFGS